MVGVAGVFFQERPFRGGCRGGCPLKFYFFFESVPAVQQHGLGSRVRFLHKGLFRGAAAGRGPARELIMDNFFFFFFFLFFFWHQGLFRGAAAGRGHVQFLVHLPFRRGRASSAVWLWHWTPSNLGMYVCMYVYTYIYIYIHIFKVYTCDACDTRVERGQSATVL